MLFGWKRARSLRPACAPGIQTGPKPGLRRAFGKSRVTPAPSLVKLFVVPLNRAGIDYMVTGGLAAVVYGHPRLTLDVDLVLRLAPREAA